MFEELFDFTDKENGDPKSSEFPVFEDYLKSKNSNQSSVNSSFYSQGVKTFEEYLEEKRSYLSPLETTFSLTKEIKEAKGIITFEEYLSSKSPSSIKSLGVITFEEYLERKGGSNGPVGVTVEGESHGMITFIEYLESKNISLNVDGSVESKEILPETEKQTIKNLWTGYVHQVTNKVKRLVAPNIQDPVYLEESRKRYAEEIIAEQRKIYDKIYFFTPGGRAVEEEEEIAYIGTAIIGKNIIG